MKVCDNLFKLEPSAIGLGFFDGVHLAHKILIKSVVQTAKEHGLKSAIVTFKKSPAEMFVSDFEYLTDNSQKESLISEFGIDYLFELDFDYSMVQMPAQNYLEDLILKNLSAKYIYTGFNHTFGHNKNGTAEFLSDNASKLGFKYIKIPPITFEGEIVSSTRIRQLLKTGNIETANKLLGYEYQLCGVVQRGMQLGRTIGFPTANLKFPAKKVQIPYGVYCVNVETDGQNYRGLLNYGIKPTINKDICEPIVEVHILDFNKNIYDKPIKVNLIKWIRSERKFSGLEQLKSQIEKDLEQC